MRDCRTCRNWYDHGLVETLGDERFYGCHIHGEVEDFQAHADCPDFVPHQEPFTLCGECGLPVPRVCMLLGSCVNCTDTDLICMESCRGGEWQRYCTHWVRLTGEGKAIVQDKKVYDVFPSGFEAERECKRKPLSRIFSDFMARKGKEPLVWKSGR